jgi:hypothetical protein
MDELLSRRRAAVGLVIGGLGAVALFLALPGNAGAGLSPPGNDGTVKIDGEEFDTRPDREPHVGCVFQVDFYGYDEGDPNADVTFYVRPPTGGMVTVLEDTVFIGQDDNGGGGSEAGMDAEATYDLTAWLAEPHPQQGWHVRLTIDADGSHGADVKHKTFWGSGCEAPPPTTTTTVPAPPPTTTTTTEATTTTTTGSPTTTEPTSTTVPTTTTQEPPTTVPRPTTTAAPTTTVPTTTTASP